MPGCVATTPVTEAGLVRLLLNPVVIGQPVDGHQALAILSGLRAEPRASFIPDDASLADPAIDVIGLAGHSQTTDLHLVNLAASHGAVLATLDLRVLRMLTAQDQANVLVL